MISMDPDEHERLEQRLLELRRELQEQEEAFKASAKPVELDQARVGRLSRMDAMQAQQMALEASRRRQNQLVKIERALRQLKTDEYGYCLHCGDEIDSRRLLIDPTSVHCISCAQKLD